MIKIDNICNKETLELCNRYKADIVTMPYSFFKKEFLAQISVDICIEFDDRYEGFIEDESKILSFLENVPIKWVQITSSNLISEKTIKALKRRGVNIIYRRFDGLDINEDIYWQFPAFSSDKDVSSNGIEKLFSKYGIYFQIDILSSYTDAWNVLKNDCGKYEEDITIAEINEFTSKYKSFIALNYSSKNFKEIKTALNKACGYTLTVEGYQERFNENAISVNELESFLKEYVGKP